MKINNPGWIRIAALLLLTSCATLQMLTHEQFSPREQYVAALQKSNLIRSALVRRWLRSGETALHDSVKIPLPFSETGFFPADQAQARFYQFDGKEGQIVRIKGLSRSREKAQLFLDLYSFQQGEWKLLLASDTSLAINQELKRNERLLVRLQPELLVNMYYSITIGTGPALIIPVKGASNKDIGSYFDDSRTIDGKKVKHEGVDIFAKKGTYVIAPTDGFVSRVGTNKLGGKVVWLKDSQRPPSYYFAHLDSQMVSPGMTVKQGDVLGTVGNTGNAKYTPSHLHFGVYLNTSVDPLSYIRTVEHSPVLKPDTTFRSVILKVKTKTAVLQSGPAKQFSPRETVPRDEYLMVIGQTKDWYRVAMADDREGYIEKNKLTATDKGSKFIIKDRSALLVVPDNDSLSSAFVSGPAEGLAIFKSFRFIRASTGQTGWIKASDVR